MKVCFRLAASFPLIFVAIAGAEEPKNVTFDYEALKALIETEKITTIEDLLPKLPTKEALSRGTGMTHGAVRF